jgi:PilZ domain
MKTNIIKEERRNGLRIRLEREFPVGVRTGGPTGVPKLAYAIELSLGGMKIVSPVLYLSLGEQVELLVDRAERKMVFPGRVLRKEGSHYIDRIRQNGIAYFIRIEDVGFAGFMSHYYFIS